jgi:anti-anti-sigma regulatory factor/DNA-directed RNA polymerase subunit RPC12/RpoP
VKRLTINKQILQNELKVELIGAIDEDSDFKELLGLEQKTITFDFNQVSMINSCGIREWIKFLEQIPESSTVIYNNCPQIIIEQINMVHGFFRKGAVINSFYAPYFCEKCEKEAKIHLKAQQVKNKKAPKVDCPNCGAPDMDFDAIEAQYFNFLVNS